MAHSLGRNDIRDETFYGHESSNADEPAANVLEDDTDWERETNGPCPRQSKAGDRGTEHVSPIATFDFHCQLRHCYYSLVLSTIDCGSSSQSRRFPLLCKVQAAGAPEFPCPNGSINARQNPGSFAFRSLFLISSSVSSMTRPIIIAICFLIAPPRW